MTNLGYKKYFSESSFKEKVQTMAKQAGAKVIYAAFLLYYLMKDPLVPTKVKITIAAALGYFILPTDAIPDIAPLVGFSDDLGVLVFVLNQISDYITPETKIKAIQQLQRLFKSLKKEDIHDLEHKVF
ncbi:YkvA family protein [Mangrovibacterium lignilyticum]|uniref:YkvA family protein n=1 Tax=Mangrovibacterium lignilyticum TaxID=2668052 RepID=UPI0013D5F422|nr:YkvA family protein [Mangrovibacterium lignilyticum]